MAGVDRVAGGVVGDQRFAFSFRGSVLLLLAVLVAQLLNLSWLESPGTPRRSAAARRSFVRLDQVESLGLGWQYEVEKGDAEVLNWDYI